MKKVLFFALTIFSLLLSACGAQAQSTPTEPATVSTGVVSEGHITPTADVKLTFSVRGTVAEILVTEGQSVKKGDILVRLADREQAEAALAKAQLDLTQAQQDYDAFVRAEGLTRAQAWEAYQQAQVTRADAEKEWEKIDEDDINDRLEDADADVQDKKDELEDAQDEYDKYKDLNRDNSKRKNAKTELDRAQADYNEAMRKYEEIERERDLARATLDTALANEAEAGRVYNLRKDGLDAEQKALSEARLNNAKAQVASAQNSLNNFDLKAPFDATVTDVNVTEGQLVGSEIWAVQIADLSSWHIETSDLTELEVVKIVEGQSVKVIPDALDKVVLSGVVESISQSSKTQSGDVLYTVKIKLTETDPHLRWGMTVQVEFVP